MKGRFQSKSRLLAVLVCMCGLASAAASQDSDLIGELVDRNEVRQAVAVSEARAAEDDARAQSWLAYFYREGLGVAQDFRRAVELDRRAANAGIARSQNALGHSLVAGYGVERDIDAGLQWLLRAAQSGKARYQFDYAQTLMSDRVPGPQPAEAVLWYQRAADQGLAQAQTNLGILYMTGVGVPVDPSQARNLFTQAAEAGDAQAQNNLGLLYVRGDGVARDYEQAARWFTLAAEQNVPEALRNLSVLYESGSGVAVDEPRARSLLARARVLETGDLSALLGPLGFPFDPRLVEPDWSVAPLPSEALAAAGGDPVAQYVRAHRMIRGAGLRTDTAIAVSLLEDAASRGLASAEFSLCLLYANGAGVPQSFERAFMWCSLAAYRQFPLADTVRDRLRMSMSRRQVEAAQSEVARRLEQPVWERPASETP